MDLGFGEGGEGTLAVEIGTGESSINITCESLSPPLCELAYYVVPAVLKTSLANPISLQLS